MTGKHMLPLDGWTAVVLAAGQGTRMHSHHPKVLHEVTGRSMLLLVLDALRSAGCGRSIVVAAKENDAVASSARDAGALVAIQQEQKGTADAVLAARDTVDEASRILIVNGDLPLIMPDSIRTLAIAHLEAQATISFLTAELDNPTGYGRILRSDNSVTGIIEEMDADEKTRTINEINVGVYAAETDWLWPTLVELKASPRDEFYLPDAIGTALTNGRTVITQRLTDVSEAQQVNTRAELASAEATQRKRVHMQLMANGVTIIDPPTTYIDTGVTVGEDTTLLPGTHLLGTTTVGPDCTIGPTAMLRNMYVGKHCTIGASTLEDSTIGDDVSIGPYCHIRPSSTLGAGAHLGNYVEIKATHIGAGSQIGHFSYLGDADIGSSVNIGAGTITANYDGKNKHRTLIGDGAFIGSNSVLVAPVTVGEEARTGASAVVTRNVPPGTTAIGIPARIQQSSKAVDGEEA